MSYTEIKSKMINGTGVGALIHGGNFNYKSSHYIDSLQRFEKDFAAQDKLRRDEEKRRKTVEIEKRREGIMNREERRLSYMDDEYHKEQEKREKAMNEERLRIKKRPNATSLPYNPINLEYQVSKPGYDLKRRDEDYKIRNLVRAHNIDNHGSGKFNPVTGQMRIGIEKLVPQDLENRFSSRLDQHYETYKIKLPESNLVSRRLSQVQSSR